MLSLANRAKTEGLNVRLRFIVSQDSRDEQLMKSLITFFDCGRCEIANDGMVYFCVTNFSDNYVKILPFFSKHQLVGIKARTLLQNSFYSSNQGSSNKGQTRLLK